MKRFLETLVVAVLFFSQAQAQQATDSYFSDTFDMQLPPASVADSPGPLALTYNPADLAWDNSTSALYLHQEALDDFIAGGSAGLFASGRGRADGLMLKLSTLGFGVQWIRPGDDGDKTDYLKYTLAVPLLRKGRWFSSAFGIELLDPTETNEGISVDFMTGALIRPFRFLSFGVVGRNLGVARVVGIRSHRILDLGMAVRPWIPDPERLTIAADLRLVEDAEDPQVRLTASVSLLDGFSLFSNVDMGGNFGVGFRFNLLRMGASGYTSFVNDGDIKPANLVVSAEVFSDNQPGFIISKDRTAEISINSELVLDHASSWRLFGTPLVLHDVVLAIHRAATDKRVDSLLFRISNHKLRWTDVQELRQAVAEFRKTGKQVFFHIEQADNLTYYLASIGDGVYVAPESLFLVNGPKIEALFLGGTLEMLGVKAEYLRVGKYKLAPEQYSHREPSELKWEAMTGLADQLADELFGAISEGRQMKPDEVRLLVDQGLMHASQAEELGLVDGVVDPDELNKVLEEKLNHPVHPISGYPYQRWSNDRWGNLPVIVVVHASGAIDSSGVLKRGMNSKLIAGILSAMERSPGVDAVVLRVDSPGGSGFGSDLIWRKMKSLKKKKPVIVSMGPLAASGGYYFSCGADTIVANPSTITGSIGVYSLFFDFSKLYEKLGIGHAVVKRGKIADIVTTFRGRTNEEKSLIQKYVDESYAHFIDVVSQGRGIKKEEVDEMAQGRVWTGAQAKQKGLVDELGGLYTAVMLAKQKVGLGPEDDALIVHLPKPKFSLSVILNDLGLASKSQLPFSDETLDLIDRLSELYSLRTQPVLAMLPFVFMIH